MIHEFDLLGNRDGFDADIVRWRIPPHRALCSWQRLRRVSFLRGHSVSFGWRWDGLRGQERVLSDRTCLNESTVEAPLPRKFITAGRRAPIGPGLYAYPGLR